MNIPTEFKELPLPESDFMFRVAGTSDAVWFLKSGRMTYRDMEAVLSTVGLSFADHPKLLDFGCGCGRILLHMRPIAQESEIFGVDIDPDTVGWCQENIPWATCSQNLGLPPLDFPDNTFDLVFNQSVFTHLDEHYQNAWLKELSRVVKPGGRLLLSVAGELPFKNLIRTWGRAGVDVEPLVKTFEEKGIIFIKDDGYKDGPFPDFYHSTFHKPWYVMEHWGRFFNLESYLQCGSLGFQDFVLLSNPHDPEIGSAPKEVKPRRSLGRAALDFVLNRTPESEVDGYLDNLGTHWDGLALLDSLFSSCPDPARADEGWTQEDFFRSGKAEMAGIMEILDEHAQDRGSSIGVDFGCGAGRMTFPLAEYYDSVTGIDVSQAMIQAAKSEKTRGNNVEYVNNVAVTLPFADNSVDLVHTNLTFQHLDQSYALGYLKEFIRILKPGGVAVVQALSSNIYELKESFVGFLELGEDRIEQPIKILPKHKFIEFSESLGGRILDFKRTISFDPNYDSHRYFIRKA